jgi:hypothetical protein
MQRFWGNGLVRFELEEADGGFAYGRRNLVLTLAAASNPAT